MARTSKTKIGGEDTADLSDRTNAASARGHAAVQQARSEAIAQQRGDQEMALRTASELSSIDDRRKQMEHQRKVDTGNQAINQQQVDLESAKAGYQRSGSAPTSPLLDEQAAAKNPRQQKLEQEMARGAEQTSAMQGPPTAEQQRQQEQNKKPMEMTGSSFVPSEEGQQMQGRKNFEADTERMRAEAYKEQTRASLIKARATDDKDAVKSAKQNLMQPLKTDAKLMSAFASGKANDKDWDNVSSMVKGVPDPELQNEVNSRVPGPRLRSFLSAKLSYNALNFIQDTDGDLPDGDVVDFTSPQMQQFTAAVAQSGQMIGSMGKEFGEFLGLKTLDDKVRFQNMLAAKSVLGGMSSVQSPQSPMGGMMPSAGQPQPQPAQGAQQPRDANAPGAPTPPWANRSAPSVSRLPGNDRPQQARGL